MLLHTHLHVAGPDQRHLLDGKALVGCMVDEEAHPVFNMHGMACLTVVTGVQEAAGACSKAELRAAHYAVFSITGAIHTMNSCTAT